MINSLALMSRWPGGAQKTPAKAPGKHGQPWPGRKRMSRHPNHHHFKGDKPEVKRPKSGAEKKLRHASRVKRSKTKLDDERAWMDW
jgi:hypothetical protein